MKIKPLFFRVVIVLSVGLSVVPSKAVWLGDPTLLRPISRGGLELVYDKTEHEAFERFERGIVDYGEGRVDTVRPLPDNRLTITAERFFISYRGGGAKYGNGFIRILPGTSRVSFEGSPYEAHLWGLGAGFNVATRFHKPYQLGVIGTWDWAYGTEQNSHATDPGNPGRRKTREDEVNWMEICIAPAVGWSVTPGIKIYSGVAYRKAHVFLELADHHMNTRVQHHTGPFVGVNLRAGRWAILSEAAFHNERRVSLGLEYLFFDPTN